MKYRRRRRIDSTPAASSSASSSQMMALSLFIMLLAFFIVLNAISTFEVRKSSKVKESLNLTFSKDIRRDDFSPSVTPDPAQSFNEGDTFERIEALFQSEITSFDATKSKTQGVMFIKVPYEKFAQAMQALDQQDLTKPTTRYDASKNFFLPTLVSIMKAKIDGAPTRLEIYIQTEKNPAQVQNQKPQELNGIINNVGEFGKMVVKAGMPEKLVNIGIAEGDPEFVNLVFRKYVAFSPVKPEIEVE